MPGALLSLAAAGAANAGDAGSPIPPSAQAALADEISRLARRDVEGLEPRTRPDGIVELDLQGRFRQVTLARVDANGEAMVGCVGTPDEAERFFGQDLRTGKALPSTVAGPAPDNLAVRAARHGMTPTQLRFYESLVEKAPPLREGKAATITIANLDGPGEGFNDPTSVIPEGGNQGTRRGEQRQIVFNRAAAIWGAFLDSRVPTVVDAQFNPLFCVTGGAVLGEAGSVNLYTLTGGIAGSGTVFPAALANKLVGFDASATQSEIETTFNSEIDNACVGAGFRWYYGLDNATPPNTVNLLLVVLHELAHGLGSASYTGQNGAFALGVPDIWARFQFDRSAGLLWSQMTNAQRAASAINPNNVLWDGPNVRIASGFLSTARDASGRVELFTPNPYTGGSSVSHWNNTATPNLLMEPAINPGLPLDLDLTRQQLRDIGWSRDSNNDGNDDTIASVAPSGVTLVAGAFTNITWANGGGFDRNVTIELSTDGGATFPTVIARNVANTGSRGWTVPNLPTTQARIRVREHDFVAPAGVSAASFAIGANTAPTFTPVGTITRQSGSSARGNVGTVADAQTPADNLAVTVVGNTTFGVAVDGIAIAGGIVSANVQAGCIASGGSVTFQVFDGALASTGDVQINVTPDAAPTLTYGAQSGAAGGSLTVNPATGPTDNGAVASTTLLSQGTYTGTISVNATNGVVSLSNLGPVGTHTITVRARDNCNLTRDASFQLTVGPAANTAPTFTPVAPLTRQQGEPEAPAITIGTVSDAQSAPGTLAVSLIGGTALGVAFGNVTNTNGTVTAFVRALCNAASGTARFQVSDGSLTSTGDLQINVLPNTPPTLTYGAQFVASGGTLTVNPATGPTDNGPATTTALFNAGTYTGTVSVGATNGVISLSNAAPLGVHTITVRATDNCGATTDALVSVQVNGDAVFGNGFEPAPVVER